MSGMRAVKIRSSPRAAMVWAFVPLNRHRMQLDKRNEFRYVYLVIKSFKTKDVENLLYGR